MVVVLLLLLLLMMLVMLLVQVIMMLMKDRYTVVTIVVEVCLGSGDVVRRVVMQMITMLLSLPRFCRCYRLQLRWLLLLLLL